MFSAQVDQRVEILTAMHAEAKHLRREVKELRAALADTSEYLKAFTHARLSRELE